MKDYVTLPELRDISAQLARHTVPLHPVLTQEQADEMTARSPNGYKWKVGEKYFLLKVDL